MRVVWSYGVYEDLRVGGVCRGCMGCGGGCMEEY